MRVCIQGQYYYIRAWGELCFAHSFILTAMHQSSDLRLDDSPTDFIIHDRRVVGRDREVYFWRIRELGEGSFQPESFFPSFRLLKLVLRAGRHTMQRTVSRPMNTGQRAESRPNSRWSFEPRAIGGQRCEDPPYWVSYQ